jgi:hypothetical protein
MRFLPIVLTAASCFATPACRSGKSKSDYGPAAYAPQSGLVFTGRRPDGREIALSNRTKWAIQPAGASATLRWQRGETVQLGQSGQPLWPAAITSRASGATAFARPAGRY